MAALFAATYPERTSGLILYGSFASGAVRFSAEELRAYAERVRREWGSEASVWQQLEQMAPSVAHDEHFVRWYAKFSRLAVSPGARIALTQMNQEIDIRPILPAVRTPTLVLHRTADAFIGIERGREIARLIPHAKFVELPGRDHLAYIGDQDALIAEVEEFLTGSRPAPEPDRVLATLLFTDIVGSTQRASELGDRRWRDLLSAHHTAVRHELERFRGREIDTAGDSFLATFDGPARAIRCACAVRDAVKPLGLEIRSGLHTGEIELIGADVGGIAVHIGARVGALAGPSEVLVSSTVKDLVAGSGIEFADRGSHVLKGVPGEWKLYAVVR